MNNHKESYTFFDYFYMMAFLFLSGSFWIISLPGVIRIVFFLVLDGILLIKKRKLTIRKKELFTLLLIIVTLIINLESLKTIIIYFVFFASALVFKMTYSLDKFLNIYVKVITLISFVSIVLWSVALIFPNLLAYLPMLTNANGVKAWNAVIAVQMPSSIRIQGFFWEPGAFQVFEGMAIIFLLFYKKFEMSNKEKILISIINIIGMGLTFSSTAYLALIGIFLLTFLSYKKKLMGSDSRKKVRLVALISIAAIIVLVNLPSWYQYYIWGKFVAYKTGADVNTLSVSTRIDAIKGAWVSFVSSPLWGNGESKLIRLMESNYGHKNAMFTYLNFFALFGVFVGTMLCKSVYDFFVRINVDKKIAFVLFVICGIMTFSENFVIVPFFLSLIFYGMDINRNENVIEYIG